MFKYTCLLSFILVLAACRPDREVHTTFYYWKTVYKQNKIENETLTKFHSQDLYIRIMDVDLDGYQKTVPIAPITFKEKMRSDIRIIPVVFIVNDALRNQSDQQLEQLAHNLLWFVKTKVVEAGKVDYEELQIDCDWTQTTRDRYFFLLKKIKTFNADRKLSVTLRLHQLKNQVKSGIPPADKVMLMMYNMGNLRQFGAQNSILDLPELKRYASDNLKNYPLALDVALPLFSWSVVFRNNQYAGLTKKLTPADLKNANSFEHLPSGLFKTKLALPRFGLQQNDIIRYEESKVEALKETANYLSNYLSEKPINLVYYHLDQQLLNNFKSHELEEIAHLLR